MAPISCHTTDPYCMIDKMRMGPSAIGRPVTTPVERTGNHLRDGIFLLAGRRRATRRPRFPAPEPLRHRTPTLLYMIEVQVFFFAKEDMLPVRWRSVAVAPWSCSLRIRPVKRISWRPPTSPGRS